MKENEKITKKMTSKERKKKNYTGIHGKPILE